MESMLKQVVDALCRVEVRGEANLNNLLASIRALKDIITELEQKGAENHA